MSNTTSFYDTVFAARAKEEIRIVLAGKTGEGKWTVIDDCSSLIHHLSGLGKSALGNAILGERKFEAKLSLKSETSVCNAGERCFDERRLIVVDTPGLFDTTADPKHVTKEIAKVVLISAPGPHCFIVTISARNRFTEEAQKTIDLLCKIFGGNVLDYCVVVFTNEDAIIDEDTPFEDWLPQQTSQLPGLAHLINSCGRRCMAFNSNSKVPGEFDTKVRQLVSMIDRMVAQNNGRIYTNDMYKEAEAAARQREAEQLRQAAEKDAALRNEMEEVRRSVLQIEYSSIAFHSSSVRKCKARFVTDCSLTPYLAFAHPS